MSEEDASGVLAKHAQRHAEGGSTTHVYMPPEMPFAEVEALDEAIANLVYSVKRPYDVFVYGSRP